MEPTDSLILVIDDNLDLLDVVTTALGKAGYRVLKAEDGFSGLEMFQQHHPDLVILDVMMPGLSGWEVLQRLRETSTVSIIMLTVLGQECDVVRGLEKGADDYVAKPFSTRELLGRVRASLRRVRLAERRPRVPSLAAGDLVLVPLLGQAIKDGRTVKLTPVELRLLSSLVRHGAAVVPSDQLLQEVWGKDYGANVQQLKVYIHYLRQKLEDDSSYPTCIICERGKGY
ncbi:MAG: response regulator transcription factor, partial [Anaerolineae bacterium]